MHTIFKSKEKTPQSKRPARASNANMLARQDALQTFNFQHGQQRIERLATFGYEYMSCLPAYDDVPNTQKTMVRYLFGRNGNYYQYFGIPFLCQTWPG